ncbi:hypothetical protein V8G54_029486 [Vigna mungo]|uniref:Uncharacterized protein n=1 Tax=Vigna mungo TaxID=3915 RepID=A0AAQ3MUQ7_VIGMU
MIVFARIEDRVNLKCFVCTTCQYLPLVTDLTLDTSLADLLHHISSQHQHANAKVQDKLNQWTRTMKMDQVSQNPNLYFQTLLPLIFFSPTTLPRLFSSFLIHFSVLKCKGEASALHLLREILQQLIASNLEVQLLFHLGFLLSNALLLENNLPLPLPQSLSPLTLFSCLHLFSLTLLSLLHIAFVSLSITAPAINNCKLGSWPN